MEFRAYRPGDEIPILALFEKTFGRAVSLDWWRWRYLENPVGRVQIMLAWDGDTLASHYAASPMRLSVDGAEHLAALSMGTMTGDAYKGQGLFSAVAETLYEDMAANGYVGVFGFPNYQIHRARITKLGWQDIAAQHTLVLTLDDAPPRRAMPASVEILELPAADFPIIPNSSGTRVVLDETTARWRLNAGSGRDYKILCARSADNPGQQAVLVWKSFGGHSIDVVHSAATNPEWLGLALQALTARAAEGGVRRINSWASLHDPLHRVFEQAGFRGEGPVTYFGGRLFKDMPELMRAEDWRLSMLTSDVY